MDRLSSSCFYAVPLPFFFLSVCISRISEPRLFTFQEGEVCSVETPNESLHAQKLREILNFVPVEDSSLRNLETGDQVGASAPFSPVEMESEHIQKMQSYPDAVIVVNTKNFNKEMIASRRVTYHRILAMEKKGVQVVERESDLPVDLIITPAICLVWYDFINIGKKASTLDEASSCLALCTENIATNVLTLLSFTFSGCILVSFEYFFYLNILSQFTGREPFSL